MFKSLVLAALGAVVLLAGVPAEAKPLRGDAFITAMQGNTLTGKMANGTPYKLYFLPGGQATIQEGKAEPQSGTWSLDPNDFEFAEITIEVCDGIPSDVEAGLVTSDRYCPWSAVIADLKPAP